MKLSHQSRQGAVVVEVHADHLEASNTETFKQQCQPILAECPKIVLDLNQISFVDSSGCGSILSLHKHATEQGGAVKICRVGTQVRNAFSLMRLHKICEIVETPEEALAAFANEA